MGVGDNLKPLFRYGLSMGKYLVVGLRPKWRSSFSRTCLYSVCQRARQLETAISARTSYWKAVGGRAKAKRAIEFPRTCLNNVCEYRRQPKIAAFVWASYGKVVGCRVNSKMAIWSFPYIPIQHM